MTTLSKRYLDSLTFATLAGIFSLLAIIPMVRLMSDDYCIAARTIRYDSITETIGHYFETFSGRYSAIGTGYLIRDAGIVNAPLVSLLMIVLLLSGWTFLLYQVTRFLNIPASRRFVMIMGLFSGLILLNLLTPQVLYWVDGIVHYGIATVMFLWMSSFFLLFLQHMPSGKWLILAGIFTFLICLIFAGFSEPPLIVFGCITLLTIAALWFYGTEAYRIQGISILLCAVAALVIGALIVISAPGNDVRRGLFLEMRPGLADRTIFDILMDSLATLAAIHLGNSLVMLMLLFAFCATVVLLHVCHTPTELKAFPLPGRPFLAGLGLLIIVLLLSSANILPGVYATGVVNERSLTFTRLLQLALVLVWGYLVSISWQRSGYSRRYRGKPVYRVLTRTMALLLFTPILSRAIHQVDLYQNMQVYAQQWDEQDTYIRQSTSDSVLLTPLDYYFEDYTGLEKPPTADWIQSCMYGYYDSKTVIFEASE